MDAMIVEALVQLAHRLGLTVTAECVETAEQAERLRPARVRHRAGVALLAAGGGGSYLWAPCRAQMKRK